jgi:hypothetical protein
VVLGSRFYPGTKFMGLDLAGCWKERLHHTAGRCAVIVTFTIAYVLFQRQEARVAPFLKRVRVSPI